MVYAAVPIAVAIIVIVGLFSIFYTTKPVAVAHGLARDEKI